MRNHIIALWMLVVVSGKCFSQKTGISDSIKSRVAPSLYSSKSLSGVLIEVKDSLALFSFLKKNYPRVSVKKLNKNLFLLKGLDKDSQSILKHPGIKFIDRADRIPHEETVLGNFDLGLNSVRKSHAEYPSVNGGQFTISIKEKPFHQDDIDLKGRILLNRHFDESPALHATLMATIAAGSGNSSPYARGVAWGAYVTSSDFERLLPDLKSDLVQSNVSVQNHSYGVGVENYYGLESKEYDLQCNELPAIVHVFSSGNRGDEKTSSGTYSDIPGVANLTGQFKVSKNTIAVGSSDNLGNVVSKSSRGPAHDGRIKPELIAYGDAGSSDAAAVVSGIAVLVQDAFKKKYGSIAPSALVKAVLLNSATDTGRPNVDFETGFGNANSVGALRIIEKGNIFSGLSSQGDLSVNEIDVPAGIDLLKVTLAWNDPPGIPFSEKALVNDLDLVVRNVATNEMWEPWVLNPAPSIELLTENAFRGKDRLNNVEQVTLSFPAPGKYELLVEGYILTSSQEYFVAYETVNGLEWIYPSSIDALPSNETDIIRWRTEKTGTGRLVFRFVSENNWIDISGNVDLSGSNYVWSTPDTSAMIQLRLMAGGENYDSPPFVISKPQRLDIGYNCEDDILVQWDQVPRATGYLVYLLGEKYLEPLLVSSDTFAIILKSQLQSDHLSFAPLFNDKVGMRELTINYKTQGTGCYFISFLPRQYVMTGEAAFDVTLGTTYKLAGAKLEKLSNGSFEEVSAIPQINERKFSITDPSPTSGIQTYRMRLFTDEGNPVISDEAQIFYVRENDLFIYPNPVVSGEDLNIVVSDDEVADIFLFSLGGKYTGFTRDYGTFKVMKTTHLPKGSYAIRVVRKDGNVLVKKLIVI